MKYNSINALDNTYCTGFEYVQDASNAAGSCACKLYFGNTPEAEVAGTNADLTYYCYIRNLSKEAKAFSAITAPVVSGGNFAYTTTALTNWATAYEGLILAKAELDIADRYYTKINKVYTDAAVIGRATSGNTTAYYTA